MGQINPFVGVSESIAGIIPLRAAAGLYLPNYNFRDFNTALYYDLAHTGEDGLLWEQFGFRNWYASTEGIGNTSHSFGTSGLAKATGYYDDFTLYASTEVNDSSVDIEDEKRVMAQTVFCGMLPFYKTFSSHWLKALTVALVIKLQYSGAWSANQPKWGDEIKVYVACYDSAYEFCSVANGHWSTNPVDPNYEEFATNPILMALDNHGAEVDTDDWEQVLAHSTQNQALCSQTRYVQVYVGIRGEGVGKTLAMNLGQASIMLNPTNGDPVTDASPDRFLDLSSVYLEGPPSLSYSNASTTDRRMADGRLHRVNPLKGGPLAEASLNWYSEDGDTKQKLLAMYQLSKSGMGVYVPRPVPICIDAGMGQLPWFAYYHAMGPFSAPFNPNWTAGNQGYDIGMQLVEVG